MLLTLANNYGLHNHLLKMINLINNYGKDKQSYIREPCAMGKAMDKKFTNVLLEEEVHNKLLYYKLKHRLRSNSKAVEDMLKRLKEW